MTSRHRIDSVAGDEKADKVANRGRAARSSLLILGPNGPAIDGASRWFKNVAAFAVLGYVLFDKSFAWVHVPGVPVFTGELVLFLAVIVLLRHQRDTAAVLRDSPMMRTAALLFVWGALRLAFDLPVWGLDALRDGAQTNYILVAMATAVVLRREPGLMKRLSRLRPWIPATVVVWVPVAIILATLFSSVAPRVPDSGTSIFSFKPGDFAIFAAAAISYVWLTGDQYSSRYRNTITMIGVVGLLVAASRNRGGMLGAVVLLSLAALFMQRNRRRRFLSGLMLTTGGLILGLAVSNVVSPLGSRPFSVGQLAANVVSITGSSQDSALQGTVTWRLDYWQAVVNDVVTGDAWLTGIGYGPIITDRYAAQVGNRGSGAAQPLRNTHNSHLTLLARVGLVGLFLWLALWLQVGLRLNRTSRRTMDPIAGWLTATVVGIGVAAIFDPTLEGPQMAIPFWCAIGLLAGSVSQRRVPHGRKGPAASSSVIGRHGSGSQPNS